MTIALGILASNGVVLASDSEMSTDQMSGEGWKVSARYSLNGESPLRGVLITGAGNAAYLDGIGSDIRTYFVEGKPATLDVFENWLQEYIASFYERHVLPFEHYEAERPDVWLIVSAQDIDESRMWTTSYNRVNRCTIGHASVGIGQMYADSLMDRLYRFPIDLDVAQVLAAYVIYLVKERIPYCGKRTQLIGLKHHGMPSRFSVKQLREMEALFEDYGRLESYSLHRIFGSNYQFAEQENVIRSLDILRKAFQDTLSSPIGALNRLRSKDDQTIPPPSPESPEGSDES
jgi:hypothetical protein